MSLYRTWRPKSFFDLVGQDAVVRTLSTALTSGRLAHAYLFSGPRGSGKTSAAKILARCINCERGPTPDPDNTCENCREMLAGSALDVLEIDAASNRGIDEIRALRDAVKFAPSHMRAKVFIIDEAHMLTREGANAFLKTLEEPPAHAVFILATTAPEALPPTILSRCQRYAFRRIPVATMIARMRTIADAESIEIDDAALGAIAYRADGGLRDALTMLEQVAAFAGGAVDATAVDAAFGTTGRAYARALVAAILQGEARPALLAIAEASDAGAEMQGLVRGAIAEYRHLLVARVDPAFLSTDLAASDAAAVLALAQATPQPKIVRGLRLLADALSAARLSGNPRLELETAVLRLVVTAEDPTLDALATRVALLEAQLTQAPGGRAVPELAARTATAASATTAAPGMPAAATPAAATRPGPSTTARATPEPPAVAAAGVPPGAAGNDADEANDGVRSRAGAPPLEPAVSFVAPNEARLDVQPQADVAAESADSAEPAATADTLARASEADMHGVPPAAAAGPPPDAVATAAADGPTLQQIRSLWQSIRTRVESERKPMRAALQRTTVDALAGRTLTIGVPDFLESMLRDHLELLEGAIAEAVGTPLRVLFRVANTRAARPGAAPPEPASATPAANGRGDESAGDRDGELGLLDYARKTIGGTESR